METFINNAITSSRQLQPKYERKLQRIFASGD